MESEGTVKILGLQWHSASDSFAFTVSIKESACTKRCILSEVARIYDPLGFLSPLTLFAKKLLQHLWTLGLDWDDTPPEDVRKAWSQYKAEISDLRSLRIPRSLFHSTSFSCQLHAFCDASESGYACVIYFRRAESSHISIYLVMAKSKVAPLKRLSIPRLELCAAVLLARLVDFVIKTYQSMFSFERIVAWSDSTVTLTWIRSSPHRWKSFVANRVSVIQDTIAPSNWRHIPTTDNPADPASRGLLPSEMLSCSLWWAGPSFLRQPPDKWPVDIVSPRPCSNMELEERSVALLVQTPLPDIMDLLTYHHSQQAYWTAVCRGVT